VVQCTALICAIRFMPKRSLWKLAAIIILILSIVTSASKTGIVTLFGILLYTSFHSLKIGEIDKTKFARTAIGGIFLMLIIVVMLPFLERILQSITSVLPIFERVSLLFTNMSAAVTSGGSGRESVWDTAIQLTKESPLA